MKALRMAAFVLVVAMLLSGCVYTNIKMPLDTDLDRTEMGTKVGTSSMYSVLWLVSWGDSSTAAAARDGGMTTVNHLDREVFSVFFSLYSRTTTIAYGD